jgi:hypothetical protein
MLPPEQPPAPAPIDPLAADAQFHQQGIDRAKLALAAQAQGHSQAMDMAGHALAVRQAMQPPAPPPTGP